ncbi:RDD family protein [Hymenobacter ginsengisoli]|uniref:RDD family protein n=1 Tax=Hymenobacter ginsengisoli TaxID=1051626 RepID=A0ABP8QQE3_9BACT|nr:MULTISPECIES: RDD family protein [unclassified Hymenobacter]MBO2032228.1 RDD family protein [Hymenobacter sp. BT559]
MATIRIHTTQNVTLEYEVASIGSRIVATILDNLIFVAWAFAVGGLVTWLLGRHGQVAAWTMGVLIGLPFVFYHLACEVLLNGQSLGKKAQHLRVIRLDGTAPRLGDYFLRWLLRLVDFGFGSGLVAVVTIALNGKGQRLGDLAAGTTVINVRPRAVPLTQLADLTAAATPVGYQPVFMQAADLSDHDVALLRQLLGRSLQQDNFLLLHETALKIKQLLGIHSDLGDEAFLRTILRDHAHLVAQ